MSRFQQVSCSQCGGEFGPGDSGYSHCSDHKGSMSADKTPQLPAPYGFVIAYTGRYSTGGYAAEIQVNAVRSTQERLFTADQMHAYARAYAAEQTRELVDALRTHHEWSLRNVFGYSENGDERVAYRATAALIAKHKEQA